MTLYHLFMILIFIVMGASGLSAIQSALVACLRPQQRTQSNRPGLLRPSTSASATKNIGKQIQTTSLFN